MANGIIPSPKRRIRLFMLIFYRHLCEGEWEMGYIEISKTWYCTGTSRNAGEFCPIAIL